MRRYTTQEPKERVASTTAFGESQNYPHVVIEYQHAMAVEISISADMLHRAQNTPTLQHMNGVLEEKRSVPEHVPTSRFQERRRHLRKCRVYLNGVRGLRDRGPHGQWVIKDCRSVQRSCPGCQSLSTAPIKTPPLILTPHQPLVIINPPRRSLNFRPRQQSPKPPYSP